MLTSAIKSYSVPTLIGVVGLLSSFVTLFVDTSAQISIKWLLLVIALSMYIVVILTKFAYQALEKGKPSPPYETPVTYSSEVGVFVIKKNEHFIHNILVGCYWQRDGLERLAYVGVVEHVQEALIQIRIQLDLEILPSIPISPDELKMLEIRPVVPFAALQHLSNTSQEA